MSHDIERIFCKTGHVHKHDRSITQVHTCVTSYLSKIAGLTKEGETSWCVILFAWRDGRWRLRLELGYQMNYAIDHRHYNIDRSSIHRTLFQSIIYPTKCDWKFVL